MTVFYERFRKVCPQCKYRSACNGRCTAVGEPKNAMKRRKALVSEEELDNVLKACKKASETREQTLHRREQNQTHMISINTYHLACAEGSALQCCSLELR